MSSLNFLWSWQKVSYFTALKYFFEIEFFCILFENSIENSVLVENSILFEFFWKECCIWNNCEEKELEDGFYSDLIEHLFEWLIGVN